jgi:hypothetical protein
VWCASQTEAIIAQAIADPDSFVLKPQREGGGNNVWGKELAQVLRTASVTERGAYVLMQRIRSVASPAPLLRKGEVSVEPCTSEFGVYSYFIGYFASVPSRPRLVFVLTFFVPFYGLCCSDGKRTFHNTGCGNLLRTKIANVNEGGVFAGFAVFDSPMLI